MPEINDVIACKGEQYRLEKRLGEGGQGSVFLGRRVSDGKEFAVKIIAEKNENVRANKIANIRDLVNACLDQKASRAEASVTYDIDHIFPISMFTCGKDQGYIMDVVEKGETLNDLLIDGRLQTMPMREKLILARKIAASIDVLHCFGYCYTDISWGNFMYDEGSGKLSVIDCENVASFTAVRSGSRAFLMGTGFFMAPEVAFGTANAAENADFYALAVLIFRLLTGNVLLSPYHGNVLYSAPPPICQDMKELAEMVADGDLPDTWQHFVFDPNNSVNSLGPVCRNPSSEAQREFRARLDGVEAIWAALDPVLQDLFIRAFRDPLSNPDRPRCFNWVKGLSEALDRMKTGGPSLSVKKTVFVPRRVPGNKPAPVRPVRRTATPAPAPAPQPAKYAEFVPRERKEGGVKYKEFVPAGVTQPAAKQYGAFSPQGISGAPQPKFAPFVPARRSESGLCPPCIRLYSGETVSLSEGERVLRREEVRLSPDGELGILTVTPSGASFVSLTDDEIVIKDDTMSEITLHKGDPATLKNGNTMRLAAHPQRAMKFYF